MRAQLFSVPILTAIVAAAVSPKPLEAQYRYPPRYPYSGYVRYDSSLRIEVKPNTASVFVDGYFAGRVDDFDGVFQRLRLDPGQHEIAVYLQGHRTLRERLYLSPNSTRKIEGALEPLGPGEPDEGPPTPSTPPAGAAGPPPAGAAYPPRVEPPYPPAASSGAAGGSSRLATLSISVRPGDADLTIDGEPWRIGSSRERLLIQLSEGRHVVEVKRQGYRPFSTEVQVKPGETTPLNISLTPD